MHRSRGRSRGLGLVGVLVVGALALVACGSGQSSTGDTSSSEEITLQSGAVSVSAVDNVFVPEAIKVTEGSTVTWANNGRNDHNIKLDDSSEFGVDAGDFKPGESYSTTLSTPGTYHYYCSIHGTKTRGMIGTIEVVAP